MNETPKSIVTARVTNIRTRLIGSMLIILILLPVAGIVYSIAFMRLEQATHALRQLSTQPESATVEQWIAVLTEISTARQSMWEVPLAWGFLIALAVVTVTIITIRSVVQPVEQLTDAVRALAGGQLNIRAPVEWADEFGQLAVAFNEMADRLLAARAELEGVVEERTRDLTRRTRQMEAAARVARECAVIQDVERLLNETVRLISEQFGFYHAGIFLLDEPREYAVLRAASSEGGQRMLARSHKLKIGEVGIVGYVAGTGESRIALDVGADAVFFNNPDLPETRSEMALPLKVRERVIGVLDVQSTEENAFSEEDVAVLQTMADQVAMAIENARLLMESQQTLAELERLYGQRVREEWREYLSAYPSAYRYTRVGVNPVSAIPPMDLTDIVGAGTPTYLTGRPMVVEEDGQRKLMAPIMLRRQFLGFITFRQSLDEAPWSQEELTLVEELCTQIGLALENARLLEATQLRAEQERIIADITARVRASMDPEIILKTAVRELGAALSTDRAFIQLGGVRRAEE